MSIADTMPGAQNTKPLDPPEMEDYSIQTLDWVQVSALPYQSQSPPSHSRLSDSCCWHCTCADAPLYAETRLPSGTAVLLLLYSVALG